MSSRRRFLYRTATGVLTAVTSTDVFAEPLIPRVADQFRIHTRTRVSRGGRIQVQNQHQRWNASETAIIVCDMWQEHPCKLAQYRADRMAPRMNEVLSWARDHGVAIIHAPSGGMRHYEGTPYRKRMQAAEKH